MEQDHNTRKSKSSIGKFSPFRIISLVVSFWKQPNVLINLDVDNGCGGVDNRYFSLLIGRNGVGKSVLLREVVDLFVYAKTGYENNNKKQITIKSLKYTLCGHEYVIERDKSKFNYFYDGRDVGVKDMKFPIIIASTMGVFDKFPYRKPGGPYDTPLYHYIGPRAGNNIIATKTYLLMQMLANLNGIEQLAQLSRVADILKFIGYDTKILLRFKVKDSKGDSTFVEKKIKLSNKCQHYLAQIGESAEKEVSLDFKNSSLQHVKCLNLKEINELRQAKLLSWQQCFLFRDGIKIDCNHLSSGEFNMFCVVMSVVMSANNSHVLVLLDEPEISQHPNWQIDIIDNLDNALKGYNCHFLIATHCHFLVSNLPTGRSNVIDIEVDEQEMVEILPLEADTFGWSAEEVLLKAFKMTTDRNRYLAEIVGRLLNRIAKNDISMDQVENEVRFLKIVSRNLKVVDPMKKIISTIIEEFNDGNE